MNPIQTLPPQAPPSFQSKLFDFYQMVLFKLGKNHQILKPVTQLHGSEHISRDLSILRRPKKTKPIIWFAAILCMVFTLLVIFFGIAILIAYLAVQPKTPVFDTPAASLTAIYFNYPQFIGGDITLVANFSNPNRKLHVRFEHLNVKLYFSERLIAAQALQPFSQSPGEARLISVHLLSSLVNAPPNLAMELQNQGQRNRVVYNMKGAFRVRAKLGVVHYSYWLHGYCQVEMTSPPKGVLIAHSCITKR